MPLPSPSKLRQLQKVMDDAKIKQNLTSAIETNLNPTKIRVYGLAADQIKALIEFYREVTGVDPIGLDYDGIKDGKIKGTKISNK